MRLRLAYVLCAACAAVWVADALSRPHDTTQAAAVVGLCAVAATMARRLR